MARLKIICAELGTSMSKGINMAIKEWNARQVENDPSLAARVDEKLKPILEAEMRAYMNEFEG